jgi:hypothetical protein
MPVNQCTTEDIPFLKCGQEKPLHRRMVFAADVGAE